MQSNKKLVTNQSAAGSPQSAVALAMDIYHAARIFLKMNYAL
jgi:hypothetical protein